MAMDALAYTIKEVGTLLGVTRVTVWRMINDGRLKATRLSEGPNARVRISRKSVEHLLGGIAGKRAPYEITPDPKKVRPPFNPRAY